MSFLSKYATEKNKWYALIFIALGLGVVIIDNTILNVSTPYILRDLHTTFSTVEWAIAGYAMTIAAVLITAGRVGEMFGYKRMYIIGLLTFVLGSFIASEAHSATALVLGRAVVQAIGAAIVLTSALSLLATNFEGKDRAVAFGVWGSIAGASATVGPLLGGFLTTYYSWRWSLRINIIVGFLVLLGTIFIRESKKNSDTRFDILGTLLSSSALALLVFATIEGHKYGWLQSLGNISWWTFSISVVPFMFAVSVLMLVVFVLYEIWLDKKDGSPILHMSLFKNRTFSVGLALLTVLTMGLFGVVFVLPVFLENVFGFNAIQTGIAMIPMSLAVFVVGLLSGFLVTKIRIKTMVISGMVTLFLGTLLLIKAVSIDATGLSFAPALALFGIGFGFGVSQLNNLILSSVEKEHVGEASAASSTFRQVGSAIGGALIGTIFATSVAGAVVTNISSSSEIPESFKAPIISEMQKVNLESGAIDVSRIEPEYADAVKNSVNESIVKGAKKTFSVALIFVVLGLILAFLLPKKRQT